MVPACVVFDLDDTLYLERDYVRSGFAAVGRWLEQHVGTTAFGASCQRLFDSGCRSRIFQEALVLHCIDPAPELIELMVAVYRSHRPTIALLSDAERCLRERNDSKLPSGLITDGSYSVQQAKVSALGIEGRLDFLIFTGALAPGCSKPHPRAYELAEAKAQAHRLPLIYVGDNPLKDFVTPRRRGWLTVQVMRPQRVHLGAAPDAAHEADARIATLDELDACLERLAQRRREPVLAPLL